MYLPFCLGQPTAKVYTFLILHSANDTQLVLSRDRELTSKRFSVSVCSSSSMLLRMVFSFELSSRIRPSSWYKQQGRHQVESASQKSVSRSTYHLQVHNVFQKLGDDLVLLLRHCSPAPIFTTLVRGGGEEGWVRGRPRSENLSFQLLEREREKERNIIDNLWLEHPTPHWLVTVQ